MVGCVMSRMRDVSSAYGRAWPSSMVDTSLTVGGSNYGFEMIDLGKDVDPEAVVEAAIENDVRLVGLSAFYILLFY